MTVFRRENHLVGRLACAAGLFGLGMCCGSGMIRLTSPVQAEVRDLSPKEAFLAGGERSEIVLKEISATLKQDIAATLKQLDTRVARIEFAAMAGKRPAAADDRAPARGAAP